MIRIVTGKLGAGKTLYCTTEIFNLLCKGRIVFTNIDIRWDEMKDLAYRLRRVHLQDSQLIRHDLNKDPDWQEKVPFGTINGCVEAFLDEIHLFFNARDYAKTAARHEGLIKFATQSRKAFVNVTLITQEASNVEKQFRSMAEWEERAIPSTHMPLGILKSLPFKFFFVLYKDIDTGVTVRRGIKSYDKRFFSCYRSFQMLDDYMIELAADAVYVEPVKLSRPSVVSWFFNPVTRVFNRLAGFFKPKKSCESSSSLPLLDSLAGTDTTP